MRDPTLGRHVAETIPQLLEVLLGQRQLFSKPWSMQGHGDHESNRRAISRPSTAARLCRKSAVGLMDTHAGEAVEEARETLASRHTSVTGNATPMIADPDRGAD